MSLINRSDFHVLHALPMKESTSDISSNQIERLECPNLLQRTDLMQELGKHEVQTPLCHKSGNSLHKLNEGGLQVNEP